MCTDEAAVNNMEPDAADIPALRTPWLVHSSNQNQGSNMYLFLNPRKELFVQGQKLPLKGN